MPSEGLSKALVVFSKVCDEDYREPDGLTDKHRSAQGAQSSVTGRYTVRHRRKFGRISENTKIGSDLWMTELGFRLQMMWLYSTVNLSRRHASQHICVNRSCRASFLSLRHELFSVYREWHLSLSHSPLPRTTENRSILLYREYKRGMSMKWTKKSFYMQSYRPQGQHFEFKNQLSSFPELESELISSTQNYLSVTCTVS